MKEKLNFATLICEQAASATGKGVAGLRDELGQDSAELDPAAIMGGKGKEREAPETCGVWGPACPAWLPAVPLHALPATGCPQPLV